MKKEIIVCDYCLKPDFIIKCCLCDKDCCSRCSKSVYYFGLICKECNEKLFKKSVQERIYMLKRLIGIL